MDNNGGKVDLLRVNTHQIKVNRKLSHYNSNINQGRAYPYYYQYYNSNQNKLINDDINKAKYQPYLEQNTYSNNSVITEYDSATKSSINPPNTYKLGKLSSNDFRTIYNIKNDNIIHKFRNNNYNENYLKRPSGNQRKNSSYKGNKRINVLYNSNKNINIKQNISNSLINQRGNFKRGTKLNISKSEIQYPINFSKNLPRNISKHKSYNDTFSNEDGINNSEKRFKINRQEKIGNYYISSPRTNFSKKKYMRQNKSNISFINKRKINLVKSPNNNDLNKLSTMKTINFNNYNKYEDDSSHSYNTCSNFYKKGHINSRRINETIINRNTKNNLEYLNIINSV